MGTSPVASRVSGGQDSRRRRHRFLTLQAVPGRGAHFSNEHGVPLVHQSCIYSKRTFCPSVWRGQSQDCTSHRHPDTCPLSRCSLVFCTLFLPPPRTPSPLELVTALLHVSWNPFPPSLSLRLSLNSFLFFKNICNLFGTKETDWMPGTMQSKMSERLGDIFGY